MTNDARLRPVDLNPEWGSRCVAVIGAGALGAGFLERFAANRPEFDRHPIVIHLIDQFPPGSGRHPGGDDHAPQQLDSTAAEMTLFTDESSTIEGPITRGPSLAEWAERVRDGSITDAQLDGGAEAGLARDLEEVGSNSFPTRRLQRCYLAWFMRRAIASLGRDVRVVWHETEATAVVEQSGGEQRIHLADGTTTTVDIVVDARGQTSSDPNDDRLVQADGAPHPRHFTIGTTTIDPRVGGFARPGTNAVALRENDRVARAALELLEELGRGTAHQGPTPDFTGFDGVLLV